MRSNNSAQRAIAGVVQSVPKDSPDGSVENTDAVREGYGYATGVARIGRADERRRTMFGRIVKGLAKGAAPAAIRAAAEKAYAVEKKAAAEGAILEPAKAKKAIREAVGRPVEGIVDPVYFELRGRDNPLPLRAKTEKAAAAAIRKRRDAGGPLGRWESVAASASEALGRPVSVATAKALYATGGGDLDSSYVGRGTRAGAPGTYGDLAKEIPAP